MISTNQFKNGIAVILNGELYTIISFQHVKPGKGGAFVRVKLRNIRLGTIIDRTFRAGEKVQDAFIGQKKLQYLYRTGNEFHFMDLKTFEQIAVSKDLIGEQAGFLKENASVSVTMHKDTIIDVALPTFVALKIVHTEPGVRGDTARQALKPAKLETGQTISVPLFINNLDTVKVDTRTGKYVERL